MNAATNAGSGWLSTFANGKGLWMAQVAIPQYATNMKRKRKAIEMRANIAGKEPIPKEAPIEGNEPLAYKLPCGLIEPLATRKEAWKLDAACIMVGCQDCQFKPEDMKKPVKQDIKRAVAMWAAHEREAIANGEREVDIKLIAGVAKTLEQLKK